MNSDSRKLIAGASCAIIAGLTLGPNHKATAQEQAAAGTLEEIVVTARRREESLMETPVSITAFTSADLDARQIEQSHQIAEATPGLVFRNVRNSSNITAVVYVRGIGQEDFIPTVQPGVGTYVDDAYVANITGALTDMLDIESIEVLRGPQGTLFGRNTIGGAIQINTVKPSEEFYGDVDLSVGDFSHRQIKAAVNVPFTDNFFGKFSILDREKDGYIDTPLIPNDNGAAGEEVTAARVALRWLTDSLTIDWTAEYSDRKGGGPPGVLLGVFEENPGTQPQVYNAVVAPALGLPVADDQWILPPGSYANLGNQFIEADAEIWGTTLTVEWDITDNLTFKSITNHREQESIDARDGDYTPADVSILNDIFDAEQSSQEFQLLGTALDTRLQWVTGLYYFEEETFNANRALFPIFRIESGSLVDNKSSAVFGQFTYDLTDNLSLTAGARYSDEKFDSIIQDDTEFIPLHWISEWFCAGAPPPGPPPATAACAAQGPGFTGYAPFPPPPAPGSFPFVGRGVFESDESQTEPYLNLAYQFSDNLMGYISYSEGFKGGGFTQRIPPGRPVVSFRPEFAEVFEVGFKWSTLENRLRLSGALFDTDYQDLQVPVSSLLGTILQNASDSEIQGAELEVLAAVSDRLQLAFGVGYLDGEYKNAATSIFLGGGPAALAFSPDNRMPSVMDWQTNASIVYRTPLSGGELVWRLDHSYVDDHFVEAQNIDGTIVPSWSVFNGSLTYIHESGRWEVALRGRNITDEYYYQSVAGNRLSNGVIAALVSPPAEWQGRFRYRF